MSSSEPSTDHLTMTSSGHDLAAAGWLDLHYQACAAEYTATLEAAGLRPGWRLLDAGCGSGSFLPLLAEQVRPQGRIDAVDLAAEHVAAVTAQITGVALPCPVGVRQGSVADLPFPARTFDALWSANVTQYLDDAGLAAMLAEARRVVRPGGLVAVKESEITALQVQPAPPTLLWHLFEAGLRAGDAQVYGSLRAVDLPAWFRRAGLCNIRRRLFVAERSAPLRPAEEAFCRELLQWLAQRAATLDLPLQEQAQWRQIGAVDAPDHILRSPDFYYREAMILVVGEVS